jgi:hypothetical protein
VSAAYTFHIEYKREQLSIYDKRCIELKRMFLGGLLIVSLKKGEFTWRIKA